MVRIAAALICCFAVAGAAPPLSTVQDTLYRADGTRFTGFVTIEWKGFEAADASQIATHNVTSPIVNGLVRVQLVPNASGSSYAARYVSDGKVQFQETWVVPASSLALRLKDVRVVTAPGMGTVTPPPADQLLVLEADVVGLLADLAVRPVRGEGYLPSRAVYVDASGALESVDGNASDCVRVDGSAGSCGGSGSGPGFVDRETPAGAVNGTNAMFTVAAVPAPAASLAVYRNGVLQNPGTDYTASGTAITFTAGAVPQTGDTLTASYRLVDSGNPVGDAGGALAGTYPNPSLGLGVVTDANVSDIAGIREAKLGLNYPTHSNAADAQVLCSKTGASTASSTLTQLAECAIPAGLLKQGDRVEVQFDYSHEGTGAGFAFEVRWGTTVAISRSAAAGEAAISGRLNAGVHPAGAQWSAQSWGGALASTTAAGQAADSVSAPLTIALMGRMSTTTAETVTARGLTVIRYPARTNP